ncbi:MAG: hypothetical protein IPO27_02000 [Bacteroidetes bacterium]|nr:hypothetical protein [Bacteroidota bacterium]
MKFKAGEFVTFKNEKLEGTILSYNKDGSVKVEVDGDFPIDVSENELAAVFIKPAAVESIFRERENEETVKQAADKYTSLAPDGTVALISLPADDTQINLGPIEIAIVNRTNCRIAIGVSLAVEPKIPLCLELIESGTYKVIDNKERKYFSQVSALQVDLLLLDNNLTNYYRPQASTIPFQMPGRDVVDHQHKGRFAFVRMQLLYNFIKEEIDIELLKNLGSIKHVPIKDVSYQRELSAPVVVDLHTEALKVNTNNTPNETIIWHQMQAFKMALNNFIVKNGEQIIFIHGVGDGVLKRLIREELRQFTFLRFRDADSLRFGSGATEVYR